MNNEAHTPKIVNVAFVCLSEGFTDGSSIPSSGQAGPTNLYLQAGQEVDFKWFSRPEAETDLTIMNPICSKVAPPCPNSLFT